MPSNVDLVRSVYADWERGDFGVAEWADPNIESVWVDGPAAGSWSGVAGMAEGSRGIFDAWEHFRVQAHEYRELDDERVLVLTRLSGRGKASGLDLAQTRAEAATVFYICHGKVTRQVYYWDRERAFTDLGLTPGEAAS